MNDAATRFYERDFEQKGSAANFDRGQFLANMQSSNGRYSAAFRHLSANPGLRALELGCGNPGIPETIASLTEHYTVIDIVKGRLGDDPPANMRTIVANLDNDFPLGDAEFDVVLAMMVVEHLYDPFHAMAEIARVVRDNGVVFVNLPNIASIRCRIDLMRGRLPWTSIPDWFETEAWDGNHLHYFTVDTVRRLAGHVGLEITAMYPVGSAAWLKRLRPQLFCHEITFAMRRLPRG